MLAKGGGSWQRAMASVEAIQTKRHADGITQLRGRDVQQVNGIWTLNLTPEAGTIKSGHARCVPLHPHLVEQGFVKFAEKHGTAPLFYRPRKQRAESGTEQSKSPAAQARQRLAAWVRSIGVKGKGLSPNHAWRHTFKQIADRASISEKNIRCHHRPCTGERCSIIWSTHR
jgi:integrase